MTTVALVILLLPSAVLGAMFSVAICVVLIREVKQWLARSDANKMK